MFKRKINFLDPIGVEKNERIFYISNISKGDIVFDVGANIGELTFLFSKFVGTEGKVHAFEPTPSTFNKLSSIIKLANKKNVVLNEVAISRIKGREIFNIYDEQYASWNTFAKRPLENFGIDIKSPNQCEVATISVDEYCVENEIRRIDLLKIDVEGGELNVLKGAENMFKEKKIKYCVFEFGQTIFDMGSTIEEFKSFFKEVKYEVRNISKNQKSYPIDFKTNLACFAVMFAKPK